MTSGLYIVREIKMLHLQTLKLLKVKDLSQESAGDILQKNKRMSKDKWKWVIYHNQEVKGILIMKVKRQPITTTEHL